MRGTPSRSRERSMPARTTSGVMGPGSGHHLVKARGRPASSGAERESSRPAITSALP